MFADPTGRRRRLFKMAAVVTGVFLSTAVAILVAGFMGVAPAHLPGLPQVQPAPQKIAEVTKPPQQAPSPERSQGPPQTPPGQVVTSPTDKPGNRPSHTPSRPHPRKTK